MIMRIVERKKKGENGEGMIRKKRETIGSG